MTKLDTGVSTNENDDVRQCRPLKEPLWWPESGTYTDTRKTSKGWFSFPSILIQQGNRNDTRTIPNVSLQSPLLYHNGRKNSINVLSHKK
mmetsp:Transcript_5072/g.7756  ORF Transcript_5072/g.7756 Transcript_5072/m.7756 type:complete len:90 (+) Transcript_5072:513-782(+)